MTKKTDVENEAYKEAIVEFRKKYLGELKNTIEQLIWVRDTEPNKDNRLTPKHKIDASVAIAKMLGSYSADRVTAKATAQQAQQQTPQLHPEEMERLQKEVNAILGRSLQAET